MKINFVGKKVDKQMKDQIKNAVKETLLRLNQSTAGLELNINFVDEAQMRELNARTRKVDSVTDVLSYPNYNLKPFETIEERDVFLGDMAICLKRAEQQAEEYGWTLTNEVVKLVVHSVLHLMGFDHIKDKDYEVMNRLEKEIATKLGQPE